MIKESGRVVAIESDCLWVETIRQSTCGSCSAQKGCGHGILNQVASGRRTHLRVLLRDLPASDFAIDDEVNISIPEQVLVMGALLVYLLPLLTMLAAATLVSQWWAGDVPTFIAAVLGFIAGIGLVKYHAVKHCDDPDLQPVVMAKRPEADVNSVQVLHPV